MLSSAGQPVCNAALLLLFLRLFLPSSSSIELLLPLGPDHNLHGGLQWDGTQCGSGQFNGYDNSVKGERSNQVFHHGEMMLLFLFVVSHPAMSIHTPHLQSRDVYTHADMCAHNTVTLISPLSCTYCPFILNTQIWSLQWGSPESKALTGGGSRSDPQQGEWVGKTKTYDSLFSAFPRIPVGWHSPTLTLSSWSCGLQSGKIRTYRKESDFQQDFCEF